MQISAKIGYAGLTQQGIIRLRAYENLDDTRLGVHLKKGISIEFEKGMNSALFQNAVVSAYINKNNMLGRFKRLKIEKYLFKHLMQ